MKKHLSIMAVCLLTLSACTKSSSSGSTSGTPTTPVSTLNITFNGKTYNLSTGGSTVTTVITATTKSNPGNLYGPLGGSTYAGYLAGLFGTNSQVNIVFTGLKLDDSSAIGTYRCGSFTNTTNSYYDLSYGGLSLIDKNDGNKSYMSDFTGKDTTSTITVSVANSTECKGTFNVVLTYNGSYYPATGDFDYKH